MKIKILTFNILLHSFMLHSSEPKNFRKVTPPNVQRLWSNYREINSFENTNRKDIAAKERESRRNIKMLYDLAFISITVNNTSAKIENLENRIESFNKNR